MQNPSFVTHHDFTKAAPGERPFHHEAGAEPEAADFAGPGATGRSGGAGRGRKSGYAPKIIDMLCDSIRRLGLSDSAAAEIQGMGASTLSRWKRRYPEIGLKLRQARLQCREYQLEKLYKHAEADNDRGLRATQWILERLYPADYARKISDRFEAMNLEEIQRTREESEGLRELLREEEAERKAAASQARAEAEARAATAAVASETALHNLHNSGEGVAEVAKLPVDPRGACPQTPPPSDRSASSLPSAEFRSTGHSQTGVWERGVSGEASGAGTGAPVDPHAASSPAGGRADEGMDDAASEDALHNCQNSRAAGLAEQRPSGTAISAAPSPYRFTASATDCHNLQSAPAKRLSANARGAAEYLRVNAARFGGVLDDLQMEPPPNAPMSPA